MATESNHRATLVLVKTSVSKRLQLITNACSLCSTQSLQAHSQQLMQQMADPVKLTEAHLALTSILTGLHTFSPQPHFLGWILRYGSVFSDLPIVDGKYDHH